jgi:K+-sensing histidine kinase KdpD
MDALLHNAVKFARSGTAVALDVEAEPGTIRIHVGNEGERIPPEVQETIFDEFSIQDVDHHHQGHGFSLAIARRIVETHGGALSVTNSDRGPIFTLSLPL